MSTIAPGPDLTSPTLHELLMAWRDRSPDAIALLAPARDPLPYGELATQVDRVVRAIAECGFSRGDRVALALPDGPDCAVATLGIASLCTAAPLHPAFPVEECAVALTNLRARALLVQAGTASPARAAAERCGIPIIELTPSIPAGAFTLSSGASRASAAPGRVTATDIALVLHTSGTTAEAKRVPLSHANLLASARANVRANGLVADDRALHLIPLYHSAGISLLLGALVAGASVVCTPGFDVRRFFDWLDAFQPTYYQGVTPMHVDILRHAPRHRETIERCSLRFVRSGGASLPVTTLAELESTFGVPVSEAYGMTETAPVLANTPFPPRPRKPGSVGVAVGCEIAIANDLGRHLPAGETGEVVVRGPNVMAGYDGDLAATEAAFWPGGWFRTGDQGHLDADGYLFLTGRLKEMINRGGEKVAPRAVEAALLAGPGVLEAVAFPMPDSRLGEAVAAAVVLKPGRSTTEAALIDRAATHLPAYAVPQRIFIVDAIPVSSTGKPRRDLLAAMLGHDPSPVPAHVTENGVAPRTDTERRVAALFGRLLEVAAIGRDDNFFDLGGDSMMVVRAIKRTADSLGVVLPPHALFESPTVASFAARIDATAATTSGGNEQGSSLLVPLQSLGTRRPLFLIPGGRGGSRALVRFAHLARLVGTDQPCYGFLSEESETADNVADPDLWLAMTADRYVEVIRQRQPNGPYLIAGGCVGGLVAIEVARRLLEDAEQVAGLILLDTRHPGITPALPDEDEMVGEKSRSSPGGPTHAGRASATARGHPPAHSGSTPAPLRRAIAMVVRSLGPLGQRHATPAVSISSPRAQRRNRRVEILNRVSPRPYPGSIVLFVNQEWHGTHPALGWEDHVQGTIEVQVMPGSHTRYLIDHTDVVAAHLRRCLDDAQAALPALRR